MGKLRMLLLPILLLAVAGCDRRRDDATATTAADTMAVEDAGTVEALLSPIRAISRAQVEYGQLAGQRAGAANVREYGQTVATDHRAVMDALDSAAGARGVTLSETGEAQEMANLVRMAHAGLENLSGEEFDLPFVRAEVESNRQLLDRLDQRAIPGARSQDMQALLSDIRAMADAHLTRARQLLAQQLGEVPPTQDTPPPAPPRPLGTPDPDPPS